MVESIIKHFHLFCGSGGGAKGFNLGRAETHGLRAVSRCIGGVDSSAAAINDFRKLSGVPGTILDLFDREQYTDFHGQEPAPEWHEATPDDIRRAAGYEFPNIVFLSAPCKGFSGLLSETRSKTKKYQALNRLTLRGVWLTLEAFKDDPAELYIFENVPRITSRGRKLLDQITALFRAYGYVVAETKHNCGELGGLAQSRERFLLVARYVGKVPNFLYEPEKRPLRAVGDVLSKLPLPGTPGIPMHNVPNLQWKTWVRLAFVEAGSDWRSLNRLAVNDGVLKDYALVPDAGAFSVSDPRPGWQGRYGALEVRDWKQPSSTIIAGGKGVQGGWLSIADPRLEGKNGPNFSNVYRVVRYDQPSPAVSGGALPSSGGLCVADPRPGGQKAKGDSYLTNGHYGVVGYDETCGAVSAAAGPDNGRWNVADPRLPLANDKLVAIIRSTDGTWHRPFTTLELAALQSLVDPEEIIDFDGVSDGQKRERIGNAVPPRAAQAVADIMFHTILLARAGQTFQLSATPIWVRSVAVALAVKTYDGAYA